MLSAVMVNIPESMQRVKWKKTGKREKEQKASLRFVICVLNFEVNMCVILQKLKNLERPLGGTRSVDQ